MRPMRSPPKLVHDLKRVPGVVDAHVFQVPDAPALTVDIDRTLAHADSA